MGCCIFKPYVTKHKRSFLMSWTQLKYRIYGEFESCYCFTLPLLAQHKAGMVRTFMTRLTTQKERPYTLTIGVIKLRCSVYSSNFKILCHSSHHNVYSHYQRLSIWIVCRDTPLSWRKDQSGRWPNWSMAVYGCVMWCFILITISVTLDPSQGLTCKTQHTDFAERDISKLTEMLSFPDMSMIST